MSGPPNAGPSQHRSQPITFLTEEGRERLPLLGRSFSEQRLQYYTSRSPIAQISSRSSSTETDHHQPAESAFGDVPDVLRCTESHSGSTTQYYEEPPNRFAALYYRFNPQKIFENRGSTARDHLASERTFLAYVRTSLALASTGVALVQLFTISDLTTSSKFARPFGMTMILMALILLGIAVYRYFLIQCSLPRNMFPVARFSIIFTTFVLSSTVVIVFGALLGGR